MKVTMKARGKNHFKIKKEKLKRRKQSIITANAQYNPTKIDKYSKQTEGNSNIIAVNKKYQT